MHLDFSFNVFFFFFWVRRLIFEMKSFVLKYVIGALKNVNFFIDVEGESFDCFLKIYDFSVEMKWFVLIFFRNPTMSFC
jgi:hypothetical protein